MFTENCSRFADHFTTSCIIKKSGQKSRRTGNCQAGSLSFSVSASPPAAASSPAP
jgi:hypothetical protein